MDLFAIVVIAVGLAMDAFAVSIVSGSAYKQLQKIGGCPYFPHFPSLKGQSMNNSQRNTIWIGAAALGAWALIGIEFANMQSARPATALYFGLAAIICIITAAVTYSLRK